MKAKRVFSPEPVNGETEAFRTLLEAHHAAMFQFAYRVTNAVDVAEDLTKECFLRLMRSPGFDPRRESLRQYLYGITRNLARQQQHANGREVIWNEEAVDDPHVIGPSFPDPLASAELPAAVQAAISALPPSQREALVLCEFEELSLDEAAAIVGADVDGVKAGLHRARSPATPACAIPYPAPKPLSRGGSL